MKSTLFLRILPAVFYCLPLGIGAQTDTISPENESYEGECGGYAPQAYYHVVTNVDGMRLRQKPSMDAPVLAVLPINKRLVWMGNDCNNEFEVQFKDGSARKGKWAFVSVWKDGAQTGWIFSGALTFTYARVDAEFDGGFDALCCKLFNLTPLDSIEFEQRFAKAKSKRHRLGKSFFNSSSGQRGIRALGVADRMAGLEFVLRENNGSEQKVTVEDLAHGSALRAAWEGQGILLEWNTNVMRQIRRYYIELPDTRVD